MHIASISFVILKILSYSPTPHPLTLHATHLHLQHRQNSWPTIRVVESFRHVTVNVMLELVKREDLYFFGTESFTIISTKTTIDNKLLWLYAATMSTFDGSRMISS